jgi:hypothetical protein
MEKITSTQAEKGAFPRLKPVTNLSPIPLKSPEMGDSTFRIGT